MCGGNTITCRFTLQASQADGKAERLLDALEEDVKNLRFQVGGAISIQIRTPAEQTLQSPALPGPRLAFYSKPWLLPTLAIVDEGAVGVCVICAA